MFAKSHHIIFVVCALHALEEKSVLKLVPEGVLSCLLVVPVC